MMSLEGQTKKVFKEYLKLIASISKSAYNKVQAVIYVKPDMMPLFAGVGASGAIRNPDNKLRAFSVREIVGLMLSSTYTAMGIDIEKEVSEIIKRVCNDNPEIPPAEMCIVCIAEDKLYRNMRIYLYHKTKAVKEFTWEYLLGENDTEEDEDINDNPDETDEDETDENEL